jgi:glycosyltransferase involved in cell wall biosynthesis
MRAKPDRILSGSTGELLWVAVAAAKLLRVPIVNSRHNELKQREGAARLQSLLDHASIRACDAVVCHGPYTADQVRAIGVPPSKIYPFEVNLEEFVSDATEYAVPKSISEFAAGRDPLYTFVGRVQENKGVFDLLRAFSSLRGSLPRAGLCYVGDGSDLAALEDEAERLGLADDVLFAGRIAHEDLPGILRASTVVVTPTRPDFPEGRCMAVLEAMAAGTPAIAPRFGAFPYAIDHETSGLLFAPGDPEDLGKCLVRVARDPVLLARLRAGARQATRQLVLSYVSFGEAIDAAFGHSMLEAGSESKEQARA